MTKYKYILSLILLSIGLTSHAQNTGTLFVEIELCRNDDGVVAVALFDQKEGFPGKEDNMVQAANAKITNGKTVVEFNNLVFSEYAISAFNDENSNNETETNWIGIPKEGVGASNNAKGRMGHRSMKMHDLNSKKINRK